MEIRAVRANELERLQAIEVAAGAAFVGVGRPEIAEDDPPSLDELTAWMDAGRCWVADDGGAVVAYVVVDLVDGVAHVEQVSVHPDAGGRGVGAALLEHVRAWAAEQGHDRVTLTTFADVPWNAPYYERLGFTVLRDGDLGPELDALMDTEEHHGLRRSERVAMSRPT
ncbi:MAG: GNAT family N-acetyltransferase [Actinomycetota bacterium]|nr:GNAT family N-acetyltransferase [Actinomycetota bacterium]